MEFEGKHHSIVIIKYRPQRLITHGIDTKPWNGFQGKRFTFYIVIQHPGNDITSELFHF